MSLTEAEHVFAGIHEDGINDFLTAFFSARPRHLNYGTSFFVPTTTVSATNVATIPFPGIPGGIHYAVRLSIPQVDIVPDTLGGPLPPGPGQLSLLAEVSLTVGCGRWRDQPKEPDAPPPASFEPLTTTLKLWARGKPIVSFFGPPGSGHAEVGVDEVEITDIRPDSLESVLECILRMILQAVLSSFQLPFSALTAGAFSLILLRVEVEDDQIKLYGDV
jgi:hypothetical protein